MELLRLQEASLALGEAPLLDSVNWVIHEGERIALLGRNGAGKSTLMRVLAGERELDGGLVKRRQGLRLGVLEQELPAGDDRSVAEVVASGAAGVRQLLEDYEQLAAGHSPDLQRLEKLHQQIDAQDGWHLQQRLEQTLSRLELPADQPMTRLSGGWRRRVALARALVNRPELLLLDEPTNHLDIATIEWLEQQLADFGGTLVFVSHDRAFVARLANRVVELDRGALYLWKGDYAGFLRYREQRLEEEDQHQARFDKALAQEENWIRQGIKARRTRNQGRVRALEAMRRERAARRDQLGQARFDLEKAGDSGRIVCELEDVSFSYGERCLLDNVSTGILRGDKLALLGPNGAGKSTLIAILLGQLKPDKGRVRLGTRLEVAYFDQQRSHLDENLTPMDILGEGREFIEVGGRQRHLIGYLQDFLFTPARARMKAGLLSGGERNRLLLARLFSQPANLLVLDEPTNDLDLETLELLESLLVSFQGTLLLVSHDRAFVDNVVTSTLVLEGDGRVSEHLGGYSDWLRHSGGFSAAAAPSCEAPEALSTAAPGRETAKASRENGGPRRHKLSYKLQLELDELPERLESLETRLEALQQEISAPTFYQQSSEQVAARLALMESLEAELEAAMERWVELEARQES